MSICPCAEVPVCQNSLGSKRLNFHEEMRNAFWAWVHYLQAIKALEKNSNLIDIMDRCSYVQASDSKAYK